MNSVMPVAVRVRDALETNVIFIDASKTVTDGLRTMLEKEAWSMVVTKSDMPVGIVTERDLLRRCYGKGMNPDRTQLESVMSSPIITIEPDAQLGQAMMLMAEKNIRRVYIVEKGKIIGRITQTGAFGQMLDIMMALSAAA